MAQLSIGPMGQSLNYKAVALGQVPMLGQTIQTTEVKNEILSRGYQRGTAPTSPTYSPTVQVTAKPSRTQCIKAAVDNTLVAYGYSKTCTRAGGCWIANTTFDAIVNTATRLANSYYSAGAIPGQTGVYTPTYSPVYTTIQPTTATRIATPRTVTYTPTYSPTYTPSAYTPAYTPTVAVSPSAYSEAYQAYLKQYMQQLRGLEFGQEAPLGPPTPTVTAPGVGMTSDEKIALGLQVVAAIMQTAGNYYQAKAERARLAALGVQIPQMTALEFQKLLATYKTINPTVPDSTLNQVAAGAMNQPVPASTFPTWFWPVMIGGSAVVLLSVAGRRRR
jgi:hypothetical protein